MKTILASEFNGAILKVQRAYRHIEELEDLIALIPSVCGDRLPEKMREDGGINIGFPDLGELRYAIPLVMGDAIHNLRAPLDYIWTALGRKAGKDTKFYTFPFHETRKNLEDHIAKSEVVKEYPDLKNILLSEIRPYQNEDGDKILWSITKYDKIDKHNFIIPTITANRTANVIVRNAYGSQIRISDITATNCYQFGSFGPGTEIDYFGGITVELFFPEGGPLRGMSVLPTLYEMASKTRETVNVFQRSFL